MKELLKKYGFADETIAKLLAGKKVAVAYGTVKLHRNVLETTYEDGTVKLENL